MPRTPPGGREPDSSAASNSANDALAQPSGSSSLLTIEASAFLMCQRQDIVVERLDCDGRTRVLGCRIELPETKGKARVTRVGMFRLRKHFERIFPPHD